jgi:hypothetical protein
VAAPQSVASNLKSKSLTRHFKDPSGYTSSLTETIWDPIPADVTSPVQHPLSEGITLDPSSDYDPKTDVAIPFSFTLTNTTKGFDIEKPTIAYTLGDTRTTQMASQATPIKETRNIESWDWQSSGWDKSVWGVDYDLGIYSVDSAVSAPSSEWSAPLAPGGSVTLNGFVIYRDRLTPAEPKGTRRVLGNLQFVFLSPSSSADKNPDTLSLSGKLAKSNY